VNVERLENHPVIIEERTLKQLFQSIL